MNSTAKILHIGGPMDGYRRVAPPQPIFQVASFAPRNKFGCDSSYDTPFLQMRTACYERKRICRADGSSMDVAVDYDLHCADLADLLIKGYRGHRNPRRK